MRIARVFPRRTNASPTDALAFFDAPGMFPVEADEVHVSVAFTWDIWGVSEDAAYTLDNSGGCGQVIAFHGSQDPDVSGDVSHTVGRNQGQETCIAFTQNQDGDVLTGDVASVYFGVRRLTPRECERLQGLPDDYTLIPFRGKPAADGNRYKAIGNGMAVPCVRWILTCIHESRNHRKKQFHFREER